MSNEKKGPSETPDPDRQHGNSPQAKRTDASIPLLDLAPAKAVSALEAFLNAALGLVVSYCATLWLR